MVRRDHSLKDAAIQAGELPKMKSGGNLNAPSEEYLIAGRKVPRCAVVSRCAGNKAFANANNYCGRRAEISSAAIADSAAAAAGQVACGQDEEYVVPSLFSHFSSLAAPRKLKMKRVFRWLTILLCIIGHRETDER